MSKSTIQYLSHEGFEKFVADFGQCDILAGGDPFPVRDLTVYEYLINRYQFLLTDDGDLLTVIYK